MNSNPDGQGSTLSLVHQRCDSACRRTVTALFGPPCSLCSPLGPLEQSSNKNLSAFLPTQLHRAVLLQKLTVPHRVEILPSIYGTGMFMTRLHKIKSLVRVMSLMNPIHALTYYFFNIHFNIIAPSTSMSCKWFLSVRFGHQKILHATFSLSHMRAAFTANQFLLHLMTLIIFREQHKPYPAPHYAVFSCHFLPLTHKHPQPNTLFSNTFAPKSFPSCDRSSHKLTHHNNSRHIECILIRAVRCHDMS